MANKLKQHFPMIRDREDILHLIGEDERMRATFHSWNNDQQSEFLDMCCGVRGIKIMYDAFFKEVMNPEYAPERLNEFLSLLLERKVRVRFVLPNDSTRITDESSLLITDIVVELEDGSLANVEVQKIGYGFPGARSACYSADLLLRQYRRVRSREHDRFSYKNIKTVYTIVLFEKSPKEFHRYPELYRHFFEQKSDTGLELELLQKYVFIPLDIFRKNIHNKNIGNKLEAWLVFLCMDDPDIIEKLIGDWPEFKPMYEEVYAICRNIQGVMDMFSKELLELDRNTVQYMIDEQMETMNRQQETINEQRETINGQQETINEQQETIDRQARELKEKELERQQENQKAQQRIAELEALLRERS